MFFRLPATIQHQIQPTSESCLATCVAMAVNVPIKELGVDLEKSYEPEEFGPWLAERGIWLRMAELGEDFKTGLYLVGVLSLNDMASMHSILLDTRGGTHLLFDPNKGREGKKHYTKLDDDHIVDICELIERKPDTIGTAPNPMIVNDSAEKSDLLIKRAAGILLVSPEKRALFLQRGDGRDHPYEWCFPGGGVEDGETTEKAAKRECEEEIGMLPKGDLSYWTQSVSVPVAPPVIESPVEDQSPAPMVSPPPALETVDFTTFVQTTDGEFVPTLNEESCGYCWAPINTPPQPLHPGCQIALDRFSMNELDIARAMAAGRLSSPQFYSNMWLFAIRITGTGAAYRTAWDEYVWRDPSIYMNDEFLARCNGLAVIWEHPKGATLDSEEYARRSIGSVFLPYLNIPKQEVWAIVKIYDDEAAKLMRDEQLSTSPSVVFSPDAAGTKLRTEDGRSILIENEPMLLDHIAVCGIKDGKPVPGVWDKAGPLEGIDRSAADAIPQSGHSMPIEKIDAALAMADMFIAQTKIDRIRNSLR